MYLRGKYWHYDFIINHKRYRGTTGFIKKEKKKAVKMTETLKSAIRDKNSSDIIIKKLQILKRQPEFIEVAPQVLWNIFISTYATTAAEHRKKMYFARLRDFCNYIKLNFPEIKNIGMLDTIHADNYRKYLQTLTMSNSTRNDHISALKMIFSQLKHLEKIEKNIFSSIKKFPSTKRKRAVYSMEEPQKILAYSSGWMRHLFILTLNTGLREGDAAMLKKDEIDNEIKWITIQNTRKTGTQVDIPILPILKEHLLEILQNSNDSPFVCPELAEMYMKNPKKISAEVKKFLNSIGIKNTSQQIDGYKHKVSHKDIHSCRHTFIYLAAAANIPVPVIQSIAGHTSSEMTRYYMDHSSRQDKKVLTEVFPKLPGI